MADAEKSLLFVIKTNLEDYNKKLGEADRNFKRTVGNIQKHAEEWSRSMLIIGGVITGLFVGATVNFAKTADELTEMSARTGIGVEELQRLGYVAKLSGSSLDGLEKAVKRMQVAISNSSPAFEELGISLTELQNMTPDEQLKRVLTAIAGIPDPATRAATAIDIFGETGTDLLPMLEGGAEGFNTLRDKANVFSDDMIENGAALQDSFDDLSDKFQGLLGHLAQTDAFKNLIDNFSTLLSQVTNWIDKHPELTRAFFVVGLAILAVGAALKAMAIGMALVQAISGVGLAKLILGLAVGAGAVIAINKMMGTPQTPTMPEVPEIPEAQFGGIFMRPQLALVGEAGPEALIPLNNLGNIGGGIGRGTVIQHFHFAGFITDEMALRNFAREIGEIQRQEGNRSLFGPSKTEPWVRNHL